jgi:5-formyltetrahydrofolate cyclo-ligase
MLKMQSKKNIQEKRDAIPPVEREKLDESVADTISEVDLPFLHTILSYLPIEENKEPNTNLITGFLEFRNPALNLAYPKINAVTRTMQAVLTNADTAFPKRNI